MLDYILDEVLLAHLKTAPALTALRGYAIAFNPHDPEQLIFGTQGRGFFATRWPRAFAPAGACAYASTAEDARFAASEL